MPIAEQTCRFTKTLPREEQFGMTSQARRAAVSVAAQVAEGCGRGTGPSYVVRIAQGCLKESETHLILAGCFARCRANSSDRTRTAKT